MKTAYSNLVIAGALAVLVGWAVTHRGNKTATTGADAPVPMKYQVVRVCDTLYVAEQALSQVEKKAFRKTPEGRLAHVVGERSQEVVVASTLAHQFADTVRAQQCDSVVHYHDEWADIRLHMPDTAFTYAFRDSLAVFITRKHRHRFLFLKWGKKSYRVRVVHFNPHSKISCLSTVAVE